MDGPISVSLNTKVADDLVIQGVLALAAMLLTWFKCIGYGRTYLSHAINIIAANDLAAQGAMALAAILLTWFICIGYGRTYLSHTINIIIANDLVAQGARALAAMMLKAVYAQGIEGPISVLYTRYYGCWWPGDPRSQGISSHGNELELLNYILGDRCQNITSHGIGLDYMQWA